MTRRHFTFTLEGTYKKGYDFYIGTLNVDANNLKLKLKVSTLQTAVYFIQPLISTSFLNVGFCRRIVHMEEKEKEKKQFSYSTFFFSIAAASQLAEMSWLNHSRHCTNALKIIRLSGEGTV